MSAEPKLEKAAKPRLGERINRRIFASLHNSSLIYNQCWEDPALDRVALKLGPDDEVLVITSGGCNALDYALAGVRRVHAVDMNPRQGALLELKTAGIRHLSHDDFFQIFGEGKHPGITQLYRDALRHDLSPFARTWWDHRLNWFDGRGWRNSFYFHGLSGLVARLVRSWTRRDRKLSQAIDELLVAPDLPTQRGIYTNRIEPRLFTTAFKWFAGRQAVMNLLGVPSAQADEVSRAHTDGITGFIREKLRYVMCELPIRDNYFWAVYLRGSYSRDCCPGYLTVDGFAALKSGLVDRVTSHTDTVTGYLKSYNGRISRFVLLDHMDWLGAHHKDLLAEEWAAIFERAQPGARAIWRSAHPQPKFLDHLIVPGRGRLLDHMTFHRDLAERLHRCDRVGTYGGFHIADLAA